VYYVFSLLARSVTLQSDVANHGLAAEYKRFNRFHNLTMVSSVSGKPSFSVHHRNENIPLKSTWHPLRFVWREKKIYANFSLDISYVICHELRVNQDLVTGY